jgi:hypothetical protein
MEQICLVRLHDKKMQKYFSNDLIKKIKVLYYIISNVNRLRKI